MPQAATNYALAIGIRVLIQLPDGTVLRVGTLPYILLSPGSPTNSDFLSLGVFHLSICILFHMPLAVPNTLEMLSVP